ncbi:MAG: glycosyltransferase [bacterium]|nr:glycosyltransferase [bacterium]
MRVLFPATHYYPVIGGIETWTKNIAEGVALRRGSGQAEIFVVTGKVKNQSEKEEAGGVKIFRTSLFALSNLSASPLIYTLSLLPFVFCKSLALIKKEKIDILHCQGFLSSFLGFWLSKLTGVPYIATVQRLEGRRNPIKNFIYRNAVLCIGASRAIGEYFKQIGCKNIEVIPNGIDLERFKNLEIKPHQGFVVITVARLEKVKGTEYLIGAFDLLMSDFLGKSDIRLSIIGDGSERKNLEDLVKKLGLAERVKFLGEIPNEKIPEYLAGADCFVLPSLKEGFGIAVLEAMAAGVPVIASRVGGILDIIEDGKTGLLIEPGNPEEIAKAISKIYQDSTLRGQLINNAMAELKRYNWQDIAERVFKIYENIIRRRNLSA